MRKIDNYNYAINRRGNIINLNTGKVRKPYSDQHGYLIVDLWKNNTRKKFKIHRLLAIAYIPNPENKPEINHKNGYKWDNDLRNLEWVTHKENMRHARKMGFMKDKKLTEQQIKVIRFALTLGAYNYLLAEYFNVTRSRITNIKYGR